MEFNFSKTKKGLTFVGSLFAVLGNFQTGYAAGLQNVVGGEQVDRGYTVRFTNPTDGEEIDIPNGSMLNFASGGVIGKAIRAACAKNGTANPLGLTHSGVVINENPKYLFSTILSLTKGGSKYSEEKYSPLDEKQFREILDVLLTYDKDVLAATTDPGIIRSYCLESSGSAKEVLKGILPYTQIHSLSHIVSKYNGNIYLRSLNDGLGYKYTRGFIKSYLGRPYEKLETLSELIRSVNGLNKKERTENVFCSELAACFYRGAGIIPSGINVSNIIPEYFGSGAREHDLLSGKAAAEIPLKIKYTFSDSDIRGKGCCGCLFSCCYKAIEDSEE